MIPNPKADRAKTSSGASFQAMRKKARAGKLGGEKVKNEHPQGAVNSQLRVMRSEQLVKQSAPAKTPRTGHDPTVIQDKADSVRGPVY